MVHKAPFNRTFKLLEDYMCTKFNKHSPELDKQFCPSSTNAKEQTNRLLVLDIFVPSPEILTLSFSSGPSLVLSHKKKNKMKRSLGKKGLSLDRSWVTFLFLFSLH